MGDPEGKNIFVWLAQRHPVVGRRQLGVGQESMEESSLDTFLGHTPHKKASDKPFNPGEIRKLNNTRLKREKYNKDRDRDPNGKKPRRGRK